MIGQIHAIGDHIEIESTFDGFVIGVEGDDDYPYYIVVACLPTKMVDRIKRNHDPETVALFKERAKDWVDADDDR